MDVSQYLEIFLDETKEHLQNLNTQILDLEANPESMDTVNEIFRAAHSLKGMAGTMGYKRMQNLTHDMENVFSEVRNGNIKVQPEMIDVLFQCLDALEEYTDHIQNSADEGTNDNEGLIKQLNDILKTQGETANAEAPKEEKKVSEETTASPDSSEEKWYDIALDSSQISVMQEAKNQGKKIYGLNVVIQENCLLKAARAFLVFKAVEEKGEIIVSNPSAQDVEDEKFDQDFTLIVLTDETLETVIKAAESVSEIAKVTGSEFVLEKTKNYQPKEETLPADKPTGTETKKTAPAKTTEKKQTPAKPVVNRTVRVDIEKLDSLMNLVSELIIAKNSLVSASDQGQGNNNGFNEHIEYLESVTTSLHESVMKVRMVPIESVVSKFPRMIRDLSKTLDKKMELVMTGEDTELDHVVKTILNRMATERDLDILKVREDNKKKSVNSRMKLSERLAMLASKLTRK